MSYINFDYFVERGVLLTEMGRPVSIFKFRQLNEPYQALRDFYRRNINPDEKPGPLQMKVFRYLRDSLRPFATSDQEGEWYNTASAGKVKSAEVVKEVAVRHVNDMLQSASQESPEKFNEILNTAISNLQDFENFKDYLQEITRQSLEKNGVAKYARDKKEEITSIPYDDIVSMGVELKPFIEKMNKLMFPRIIARSKGGLGNQNIQSSKIENIENSDVDETSDPENTNTQIILSELLGVLYKKSKDEYNPEVSDPVGIWGMRDSNSSNNKSMDYYIKNTSKAEVNASIKPLADLIEAKLEKNTNQSLDGVKKAFESIKKHPKVSNNLKGLLDSISNKLEEDLSKSRTSDSISGVNYFGYDPDIFEKILNNDQLRRSFSTYKTAINKIKENNVRELQQRYETKMSEILNKLEGKHDLYHKPDSKYTATKQKNPDRNPYTDELETANILVKIARKNLMKLQTTTLVDPEKVKQASENIKTEIEKVKEIQAKYDQWEADRKGGDSQDSPIGEGVMLYMTEQFKKDIKFGKQHGQFVDRGYKKVTNYGQWMMLND